MHQPAAHHGQIGFRSVKLPVGFRQQPGITSEHSPLIEQSRLPDPLVHPPTASLIRTWADSGCTPSKAGASAQNRVIGSLP
jgi:hypothetical protein